ncbi:hypothetical protein RUM44_010760 [Polyplax serrata]|uniref:Uncharacterized protein n=1 Tax=Polyplax serrata TaxID=468196 RepID=A0ABR1AN43_POLSC
MATCFDPVPPSKRQFDVRFPAGRPPRHSISHRPPRVQSNRTELKVKNTNEINSRQFLSSTYRSFCDPCEDNLEWQSSQQKTRRRHSSRRTNKENESCTERTNDRPRKHRRERIRSRTHDGYNSDSTLMPNKKQIFLSTFKSNDNEFESALLFTLREKSRSTQNLAEMKKNIVISPRLKPATIPTDLVIEKFDKGNLKRCVTFSEGNKSDVPEAPKKSKYSVLKFELPRLTFEQMKNSPNTIHPKRLYSTTQYQDLHLTVFYGDECINPPVPENQERRNMGGKNNPKRLSYAYSGSLRRNKVLRGSIKGRLFRSQSDGNLDSSSDTIVTEKGDDRDAANSRKYLRVLNRSWRNLLTCKFTYF